MSRRFYFPDVAENKKQSGIEIIDLRWEELRNIIEKMLEARSYLEDDDFRELFYAWGLNYSSMWYAFAKYAAEHPGKVHFGDIRCIQDKEITHNVLIQVERLDYEKYEYR